jgi:hypothetical protein
MTTDGPKVIYRGVSMIEGWPEKIQAAQTIVTCEINGTEVPRVRYGDEEDDWGADKRPCHDCGVLKGELHVEGCEWKDALGVVDSDSIVIARAATRSRMSN